MAIPSLPRDGANTQVPLPPAKVAVSTSTQTVDTSTTFAITAGATFIEASSFTQAAYLKWGSTAVTSSNADHTIQAGSTIHRAIPVDTTTGSLFTTMRVIGQAAGATVTISQF